MHMALLVNSALNIKNNNMENPKGENLCNCGPETFLHGKTGTAECRPHTNEIKNLTPVKAVRDDSAHWYVIPADRLEEFRHLSGVGSNEAFTDSEKDELERMFDEKFSQYRTNGDLNNKQLYAEL